jgi:WD40 repeat protein
MCMYICLATAVLAMSDAPVEELAHHDSEFAGIGKATFSHDGDTLYYLSGDLSGTSVYAWKRGGKGRAVKLYSAEAGLDDILLSKDGKQLVLAQSKSLVVLELESGKSVTLHREGKGSYITALSFTDDGRDIIFGTGPGEIKTWSTKQKRISSTMDIKKGVIISINSIPRSQNYVALVYEQGSAAAYLLDLSKKEAAPIADGISAWRPAPDVSGDGRYFSAPVTNKKGVNYDTISIVKLDGQKFPITRVDSCPIDPVAVHFSTSGDFIIAAGSKKNAPVLGRCPGEIAILDRKMMKWVKHEKVMDYEIHGIAISPKRDFAALYSNESGRIVIIKFPKEYQ